MLVYIKGTGINMTESCIKDNWERNEANEYFPFFIIFCPYIFICHVK